MKITGIIAEYNPFHRGHQYQIQEIKKSGCGYVVAVISGDFVQRGAPAAADKYIRAKMALLGGADLVLELPAVYAAASAEGFARGGILTLVATGLTDTVSFGMEQPDMDLLQNLSEILTQEPLWYRKALKEGLKEGLSYPAARSRSLPKYAGFLASPNNILALEYAIAVKKYAPKMELFPIRRLEAGYHEKELAKGFSSAGAIRAFLKEHGGGDIYGEGSPLADALPQTSLALLKDWGETAVFLYEDDLSLPLHCRLLGQTRESLLRVLDISPALADRILGMREDFTSFSCFCQALKTKDLTYTRISRALLHLSLGITGELAAQAEDIPYLRVLGFRREAASLLGIMQEKATVPLITSLAEACSDGSPLSPGARAILQADLSAHDLYRALLTSRTGKAWPSEFRQRMLVVE